MENLTIHEVEDTKFLRGHFGGARDPHEACIIDINPAHPSLLLSSVICHQSYSKINTWYLARLVYTAGHTPETESAPAQNVCVAD